MASYLPSIPVSIPYSWQKRLLVFALNRLDFIDINDLDLDNLGGLTWGRRSVVELKNVSIKIATLAERANLPAFIEVEHASVRILRLTVPADLGTESIHVEVEGVRISARIRKDEDISKSLTPAPSHKDVVNRPRSAPSSLHDPGGKTSRRRDLDRMDASHILPTSSDLAASFLETETRTEREELEAIVGQQSTYMAESVVSSTSSTDENADVGLAGAFTLPTFLTGFFQGVGDRLTLKITDVEVDVCLELIPLANINADQSNIVLKLDEVDISSLLSATTAKVDARPPRKLALYGICLDLEVDPAIFSHPSSPKLDRQSTKSSSSQLRSSTTSTEREGFSQPEKDHTPIPETDQGTEGPTHLPRYQSLVASDSSSSFDPEQSISSFASSSHHEAFVQGSQHFPTASRLGTSSMVQGGHDTDEDSTGQLSESSGLGIDAGGQLLSESTLFTHDQAESMYMSAISQTRSADARPMPGAWDESSITHANNENETAVGMASTRPDEVVTSSQAAMPGSITPRAPTPILQHAQPSSDPKDPLTKSLKVDEKSIRLAYIDYIVLILPDFHSPQSNPNDRSGRIQPQQQGLSSHNQASRNAHLLQSARSPQTGRSMHSSRAESTRKLPELRVDVGQVRIDVDLGVCKVLVRLADNIINRLPSSAKKGAPRSAASIQPSQEPLPYVTVGEILLNFHEGRNLRASLGHSVSQMKGDDPLLSLSLKGLELKHDSKIAQHFTVSTIKIRHASQDVLWFVDTVNVRESIASSAMLRPHDLTVNMDGERSEVFIKPVHVVVDLLLVDDVLSRGGGLDSLLELGNSVMSTRSSVVPAEVPTVKTSQRTVRFQAASHTRSKSDSESSPALGKINIRISGAILDLVGSEASIQVKTSAIKFAIRPGAARVVVDGAIIEGPITNGSKGPLPIYVKLKAVEVVYLDKPEETDLDRLLSLITPSNDKYEDDDDIMVDTLVRQRRKGGVIRVDISEVQLEVMGLDWQDQIAKLSDELSKLTAVAKYLPEDDRPGVLTFALLKKINMCLVLDRDFGSLLLQAELLEGAHISIPALMAAQVSTLSLARNKDETLVGEVLPQDDTMMGPPMLMCRFIADEMEPTVRLKLTNTCVEYKVSTLVAVTDFLKKLEIQDSRPEAGSSRQLSPSSSRSSDLSEFARKVKVSVVFRDSAAALCPTDGPSKGLLLLTKSSVGYEAHKTGTKVSVDVAKASLLIVNDVEVLGDGIGNADEKLYFDQTDQVQRLTSLGYVPVASLSAAVANVLIVEAQPNAPQTVDVELTKALLFMETCADSTQTMAQLFGGLSPPAPPSKVAQYRTEIVSIENMLASFSGNAYVSEAGPELGMDVSQISVAPAGEAEIDYDDPTSSDLLGGMYADDDEIDPAMEESYAESETALSNASSSVLLPPVSMTAPDPEDLGQSMMVHSMLDFREGHFDKKTNVGGTAHRWNSTKNTYEQASEVIDQKSPFKLKVRDVHIIWNLFDGYDWQGTRDTISQAVRTIEEKAMSRRPGSRTAGLEEDDEDVIGDVLFNSIYISIPASKDPRDLASAINHGIDDMVSETGSYATSTTVTATPSRPTRRQSALRPKPKKLKLNRSKHHKISFELQGLAADFVALPPGRGEVQSSIDVRVHKLEIFDNVPTSTWKKFATYLHDAGEREVDTSMVHVELLNVKPVPDLAATEIVMKLTVLPLRLHVDQDALDFMARFFEFKDDRAVSTSTSAPPFIQRVEVNPIKLQLDYKPKKVDYAGLRSGRTTEFMNFLILERTNMVLRRVILYGVSGFDRMGIMLNNIWSPDVRRNQLPTVLAGLAPVRPLVDVASGVRELVAVPIREYRKDGRIVRSIQKGAVAFAKTTATELVNLGAKLAIGTQQVLQNAEEVLVPTNKEENPDSEATRQISLYADQPVGIMQGLRGAYASLERDLLLARDAIVAIPGEVMADGTATGAAKAVLKQSPTIILRPAIGATKAVGQTLLGAGNVLDKRNLRRIEDVSTISSLSSDTAGHSNMLTEIQTTLMMHTRSRIMAYCISGVWHSEGHHGHITIAM